jgi:hypothetical protein
MLKLYADESVDDETSLMNLAGFLMTEDQFLALDEAVKSARKNLPYFHMKEGHHLKHPDIYQSLVDLVHPDSVICSLSVSVFLNEYKGLSALRSAYTQNQSLAYWFGGTYTFALGAMMALCSGVLDKFLPECEDEQVAYVFESHPQEGDANTFWNMLHKPQYADRKQAIRYVSHTFVDGKGPLGSVLQLCDILAWNINKMQRDKRRSPELEKMFQTRSFWKHHGPTEIRDAFDQSLDRWERVDKRGRPYKS